MFYTDNTVTGIERIIAQCQGDKIIVLYNYFPDDRWEIVTTQKYQPVRLDGGSGTLDMDRFVQWLEYHGYKMLKF